MGSLHKGFIQIFDALIIVFQYLMIGFGGDERVRETANEKKNKNKNIFFNFNDCNFKNR